MLAISTESGCILFYEPVADTTTETAEHEVPKALLVGQLEDRRSGAVTRVKCFEVLKIPNTSESSLDNVIVTGSSDGSIRIWNVDASELEAKRLDAADNADTANSQRSATVRQIGSLVGKHETGNRITCLKAFTLQSSTTESSGDDESEFGGLDSDNAKD